jgi:hypothetical protein
MGEIVTFSYELSTRRDTPANAEIFRTRTDVLWEDVANSYAQERRFVTSMSFFFRTLLSLSLYFPSLPLLLAANVFFNTRSDSN